MDNRDSINNPVLKAIFSRRSVREFEEAAIEPALVRKVLEAGIWAPSGLNNQPWRFAVVTDPEMIGRFEPLTRYGRIVRSSRVLIPVFVDRDAMYHEVKDHQAVGACMENMLLAAHSLGLGAVWLGEILKSGPAIRKLLGLGDNLELMAVVAMGWPVNKKRSSTRKSLEELIVYTDCEL